MEEIAYLRRIQQIMNKKGVETKELVKVSKAFESISLFRKTASPLVRSTNKRTFQLNKTQFQEIMLWINDYAKSNGIDEKIFTNMDSFEISSDDYDYYYELKTPTQYIEEEKARKAKKNT